MILPLLLMMLAADPAPVEPPKPVPVAEKARADYWRAMYAKLAAQMQMSDADKMIQTAVAALCDVKLSEPVPSADGEPMCKPKPDKPAIP